MQQPEVEKIDDIAVVKPAEKHLDLRNADEFKRLVEPVLQVENRVVFDLGNVRFVDSSGLGALINLQERCDLRKCHLGLVCPEKTPSHRLLEVTELADVFTCYDSRDSALHAIREDLDLPEAWSLGSRESGSADLADSIRSLREEVGSIKEGLARIRERLS